MAHNDDGQWFIGDFGNNDNIRDDLIIYRFSSPSLDNGNILETASIPFTLSDQTSFPPDANSLNFDIEAMVANTSSIFLFSRNRSVPFSGICKVYRLENLAESQTAQLSASFFASSDPILGSIRGAALSPSGDRLALISSSRIYLWDGFSGVSTDFNAPTIVDITIPDDYEGIAFLDECILRMVTDGNGTSQLFEVDLCTIGIEENRRTTSQLIDHGHGRWSHTDKIHGRWTCFDMAGRLLKRAVGIEFDISDQAPGHYIIHFRSDKVNLSQPVRLG
jgi:hypothetical protein